MMIAREAYRSGVRREAALHFACPACGATPLQLCRGRSGRERISVHAERLHAATLADDLRKATTCTVDPQAAELAREFAEQSRRA
jgi:hypothetical protein